MLRPVYTGDFYEIDLPTAVRQACFPTNSLQLTTVVDGFIIFFLLLGWSNWKSDLFGERIREGFCLGCRPKPVSYTSFLLFCLGRVSFLT